VSLAYDNSKFYRGPFSKAATDWTGISCSDGKCPKGDNPATVFGQNEIQRFSCLADAGKFQIFFRENVTMFIENNASVAEFELALEQMMTISTVDITVVNKVYTQHDWICHNDSRYLEIEFTSEFGDLPLLQVVSNSLSYKDNRNRAQANITEIVKGTKEDVECSGQGICGNNGVCKCVTGYMSSNGTRTFPGERGDCTYFNPLYTVIEHAEDTISPGYSLSSVTPDNLGVNI